MISNQAKSLRMKIKQLLQKQASQMSHSYQNHIPSPQTSSKTFIGFQKHDNLSETKLPEYCSYFYRNSIQESNPSPSPSSSNTNTITISKSKQAKKMKSTRLLWKGTSEDEDQKQYTMSSIKNVQEKIRQLKKENEQLRSQIIELKVNQFYQFDSTKLKDLILEVEKLKVEIFKLKQENEGLKIENDFLNRTNFKLKNQKSSDQDLLKNLKDFIQETRIHHQSKESGMSHQFNLPVSPYNKKINIFEHQKQKDTNWDKKYSLSTLFRKIAEREDEIQYQRQI